MLIKLTVSCYWHVAREDEVMATKLVEEENPVDAILDYMQDALEGDKKFSNLEASASQPTE